MPIPLLIAPTPIELAAVRRTVLPWLSQGRLELARCGMGPQKASAFGSGLDLKRYSCLVLVGWAGGLIPGLKAGDVVCADRALRSGQEPLVCRPLSLPNSHTGSILTVDAALATPDEKRQGQTSGALAVEMEAYPLAETAVRAGLPFFHVRLILDALDEPVPDLGAAMSQDGQIRPLAFVAELARRPGLLKELTQFSGRIRQLNPALSTLAGEICAALFQENTL